MRALLLLALAGLALLSIARADAAAVPWKVLAARETALAQQTAMLVPGYPNRSPEWQCAGYRACLTTDAVFRHGGGAPTISSGPVAFAAVDLRFASASGSDSNSGMSPASPWASTNHAMNCGDAVVAASGSYNGDMSTWGAVSNCPSTTGGTTGSGGVMMAVLLCGGNLDTCNVNCATAACNAGHVGSGGHNSPNACFNVNSSNWAIEGFSCNGNGANNFGFQVDACLTTSTILHHIAFINDKTVNAGTAFSTAECGYNTSVPGNGIDEWAVLGSYGQNANLAAICVGAFDDVAAANFDPGTSGTHKILAGNFGAANGNNPSCTTSDGEWLIMDTFDAHGYSSNTAIYDNMAWSSSWVGIQIFQQTFNSASPRFDITRNTMFNNELCPFFQPGSTGEINLAMLGNFPWTIAVYNNITKPNHGTQPFNSSCSATATAHPYGMLASAGAAVTITTGGAGLQNVFDGSAPSCDNSSHCDSSNSVIFFNSATITCGTTNTCGTDPAFVNPTDLLANWVSPASCSSFTNIAACMGWNYASQTATVATPVGDLTPTAGGMAGKGYQPPGPCTANTLWPAWVDYIAYLQWNGTSLTLNPGLVNKPCGV